VKTWGGSGRVPVNVVFDFLNVQNHAVQTFNADIQIAKSFLAANGSNADKATFLNLSTVQPATRLSSSLCANSYQARLRCDQPAYGT
jgi:hypothetical protein